MENNSKNKRGIIICRVSTAEQAKKGTSLESQEAWGISKANEMDIEIIKVIKGDASGERFPIDNYDSLMKLAENSKISYVFVYSFDRLSRNFPYGVLLVQRLWEIGVKIVTSTFTPDLDRLNHRLQVWFSLLFAEMEHGGIHERTRRGMITKFMDGVYPLPWIPFGYERIDLKIHLKHEYKPVIRFIFETFIQVKSYNETARRVNEKYGMELCFELKSQGIRRIVQNRVYVGYLSWNGMLFGEGDKNDGREELKAINKKTFEMAQVIVKQINHRYSRATNNPAEKLVEDYGSGYMLETFDNLKVLCPKCSSDDLQRNGTEETMKRIAQVKYVCKKCDHQFRFPSGRQCKKIENLISDSCGKCGAKNQFVLLKDESNLWQLRCNKCRYTIVLHEYRDKHTIINAKSKRRKKIVTKKRLDIKQTSLKSFFT